MARIQHFIGQHTTTLRKTASYYLVHIAVAALVAYAVTGNLYAALTLSLLEPTVQAFAFFFHEKAWQRSPRRHGHTLAKTGSYYLLHMSMATAVAYTVTGNWVQAFTLSLLEPAVQMVFFYALEKLWERRLQQRTALAA